MIKYYDIFRLRRNPETDGEKIHRRRSRTSRRPVSAATVSFRFLFKVQSRSSSPVVLVHKSVTEALHSLVVSLLYLRPHHIHGSEHVGRTDLDSGRRKSLNQNTLGSIVKTNYLLFVRSARCIDISRM